MLSARKLELLARLKVQGLDLRQLELNFYMSRYIMVAALSSIMTGLSYVGIIKIKIPEDMQPPHPAWQVTAFYVFACLAMGLSLFNLTVTSFCLVLAQGLSLRGPPGSVARSVAIFRDQWVSIRTILQLSIISIVVAGVSVVWMKLDRSEFFYPTPPIIITSIVGTVLIAMFHKIYSLSVQLQIPDGELVAGDMNVNVPGVSRSEQARLDLVMEEDERIDARR